MDTNRFPQRCNNQLDQMTMVGEKHHLRHGEEVRRSRLPGQGTAAGDCRSRRGSFAKTGYRPGVLCHRITSVTARRYDEAVC